MRWLHRPVLLVGVAMLANAGAAHSPKAPLASYGAPIALSEALSLIDQGMKLAAGKGFKMAFAIVEPSGEVVAFAKMDDAPYAATRIAQQKARASARFRLPTAQFEERVLSGRTVLLSSDEVIAVGGGVPIVRDGRVIGALGVSGGSSLEDAAIATDTLASR